MSWFYACRRRLARKPNIPDRFGPCSRRRLSWGRFRNKAPKWRVMKPTRRERPPHPRAAKALPAWPCPAPKPKGADRMGARPSSHHSRVMCSGVAALLIDAAHARAVLHTGLRQKRTATPRTVGPAGCGSRVLARGWPGLAISRPRRPPPASWWIEGLTPRHWRDGPPSPWTACG